MNELYLEEDYAILSLPKETVEIKINAKVYHDGELVDVERIMDMQEVRDAFKEAEDGYIPSDATFRLTEKGLEYLEGLDD